MWTINAPGTDRETYVTMVGDYLLMVWYENRDFGSGTGWCYEVSDQGGVVDAGVADSLEEAVRYAAAAVPGRPRIDAPHVSR